MYDFRWGFELDILSIGHDRDASRYFVGQVLMNSHHAAGHQTS